MTYFELFGMDESFLLDTATLKKKYYQLSRSLHPDVSQNETDWEEAASIRQTEKINMAYETLRDPFKRMKYLLETHHVLDDNQNVDQSFLLEVMEINENIMELEMDFDSALFNKTRTLWQNMSQSIDNEIQPHLIMFDQADRSQENFNAIKEYFLKLKYLLRINEKLSTFAPA